MALQRSAAGKDQQAKDGSLHKTVPFPVLHQQGHPAGSSSCHFPSTSATHAGKRRG